MGWWDGGMVGLRAWEGAARVETWAARCCRRGASSSPSARSPVQGGASADRPTEILTSIEAYTAAYDTHSTQLIIHTNIIVVEEGWRFEFRFEPLLVYKFDAN